MFEKLRTTCREACAAAAATVGAVNEEGIATWVASLKEEADVAVEEPHSLPFRFDDFEQELNFLAVRNLLSFGSAQNTELHRLTGKNAHDTILFGVISMHISGRAMTAREFARLALGDIEPIFSFPLSSEAPTELSGVTMLVASPLRAYGEQILAVLRDTAAILLARGMQRLSQFVIQTLSVESTTASELVTALTSTFPAFRDVIPSAAGTPEFAFHCKAVAFVHELFLRFHASRPEFNFLDHASITPGCSPLVVATARRMGLLTLVEPVVVQFDEATTTTTVDGPVRAQTLLAIDAAAAHLSTSRGWSVSSRQVEGHLLRLVATPAMHDTHVPRRTDTVAF